MIRLNKPVIFNFNILEVYLITHFGCDSIILTIPPKMQFPFRCYIYQSSKGNYLSKTVYYDGEDVAVLKDIRKGRRHIVGEFICDRAEEICEYSISDNSLNKIEANEWKYYIKDLKVYDKPEKLRNYYTNSYIYDGGRFKHFEILRRPPKRWCYIEGKFN